ncbi:MAG: hypothetical protein H6539_01200 [Bacteroidales bacterium]|nr:hypothetical protein [Bacteroidales bacterium]
MDLKTQLLSELSRRNADFVIHAVGDKELYFRELIAFILEEKDPLPMRAAWVVEGITQKHPELITPYIPELISELRNFSHPGTRRSLLKIFARTEIDKDLQGFLIDICFEWISAEDKTVAEKVHCMQIIANHIKYYPDLEREFMEILEEQAPRNSVAYISRVRQIKKQLIRQKIVL